MSYNNSRYYVCQKKRRRLLKGVTFKLIVGLASVPKRKFSACLLLSFLTHFMILLLVSCSFNTTGVGMSKKKYKITFCFDMNIYIYIYMYLIKFLNC